MSIFTRLLLAILVFHITVGPGPLNPPFSSVAFGSQESQIQRPLEKFESKKLVYTLLTKKDKENVIQLLSDEEVAPSYWASGKVPAGIKSILSKCILANEHYRENGDISKFRWVVKDKEGNFVGIVGLNQENIFFREKKHLAHTFVIAVDPKYKGKGLGTEMEETIVNQTFTAESSINLLGHIVNEDNIGSIKIAEKCGFQLNDRFEDGGIMVLLYSLSKSIWEKKMKKSNI